MERGRVAEIIKGFMGLVACQEIDVLDLALDIYGKRSLDFVDCVLYGYHKVKGVEIAAFDRKLMKLMAKY